jgi:hypothetical protein
LDYIRYHRCAIPLRCPIIITDALIYLPAGDLAFGEGFGCLQNADYHPWVRNTFGNVKALSFMQACMQYQTIMKLLHRCILPSLQAKRRKHYEFSWNRAKHHMEADSSRKDFMSNILKHNDKKGGITDDEITANAAVLTLAGSETTATLLSGLTYHLLKNPEALRKLTAEIRSAFATEDEIDFKSVKASNTCSRVSRRASESILQCPWDSPEECPPAETPSSAIMFPKGYVPYAPQFPSFATPTNDSPPPNPDQRLRRPLEYLPLRPQLRAPRLLHPRTLARRCPVRV